MAEEAGAAGDEEVGVAEGLEWSAGMGEDVGEVFGGKGLGGHAFLVCPLEMWPGEERLNAVGAVVGLAGLV